MWVEVGSILITEAWPDAPEHPYDGGAQQAYLKAAYEQCVAFAPVLADGDPVPHRYRLAQVLQARALHRSTVAGSGDQVGDVQGVTVFPMDWTVKNLLRPRPGVPTVV